MKKLLKALGIALLCLLVVVVVAAMILPAEIRISTQLHSRRSADETLSCLSDIKSWGTLMGESEGDRFEPKDKASAKLYFAKLDHETDFSLFATGKDGLVRGEYMGTVGPASVEYQVSPQGQASTVVWTIHMKTSKPIAGPIGYRLFVHPYRDKMKKSAQRKFNEACGKVTKRPN